MDRKAFSIAILSALALTLTSCSAGEDFEELDYPVADSTAITFRMQQSISDTTQEDSTQIQLDIQISEYNEDNMDTDL